VRIVGIDLAGKPNNPTGFCLLVDSKSEVKLLHTNEEILCEIERANPELIAIDAPFGFPEKGWFREADKLLKEKGFKPLPPVWPGMRPLVERAISLVKFLRHKGYRVIEVFPRASEKILGLQKAGRVNSDRYDALLCALTGKAYLEGNFEDISGIIIPRV